MAMKRLPGPFYAPVDQGGSGGAEDALPRGHFGCIGLVGEDATMAVFRDTIETGRRLISNDLVEPVLGIQESAPYRDFLVYIKDDAHVGVTVVCRFDRVEVVIGMITAAPTIHDGSVYDVELEEVIPDGEGRSAILEVLWVDEVPVSFHDTRYLLARGLYKTGYPYKAHIAAMAYRVEAIQSPSFEITDPDTIHRLRSAHGGSPDDTAPDNPEPLVVQTAGMSVYFPDLDGSPDEASIQGPVRESEWRRVDGMFFLRLVLRIADVGDEGFDLVVCAISNAVIGDTPKVGDDVSASVWLHGHLVME